MVRLSGHREAVVSCCNGLGCGVLDWRVALWLSGFTVQGSNQRGGRRVGQGLSLKRAGPQIWSPHQ